MKFVPLSTKALKEYMMSHDILTDLGQRVTVDGAIGDFTVEASGTRIG